MILIVQSNSAFRHHIVECLNEIQAGAIEATNQQAARKVLEKGGVRLVLSDVELSDGCGFTLCQHIQRNFPGIKVVFVSTSTSAADRILGLEIGAEDYIAYPCQAREIQARVNVQLRNLSTAPLMANDVSRLVCGDIIVDEKAFSVSVKHRALKLTATEFSLLKHLASHPNQVFSKTQLLDAVWGYQHSGYEHTVCTHINRLRAKLRSCGQDNIETVWGVGYTLRLTKTGSGSGARVVRLDQKQRRGAEKSENPHHVSDGR